MLGLERTEAGSPTQTKAKKATRSTIGLRDKEISKVLIRFGLLARFGDFHSFLGWAHFLKHSGALIGVMVELQPSELRVFKGVLQKLEYSAYFIIFWVWVDF